MLLFHTRRSRCSWLPQAVMWQSGHFFVIFLHQGTIARMAEELQMDQTETEWHCELKRRSLLPAIFETHTGWVNGPFLMYIHFRLIVMPDSQVTATWIITRLWPPTNFEKEIILIIMLILYSCEFEFGKETKPWNLNENFQHGLPGTKSNDFINTVNSLGFFGIGSN